MTENCPENTAPFTGNATGNEFDFLHAVLKAWVGSLVGTVIIGMSFSLFSQMGLGAWCSWGWVVFWCVYVFKGVKIPWSSFRFWPLLLLLALTFVSLCVGLHAFLDSLTYRFPQMLFWLQEGRPHFIPHWDWRLNEMPHVWSYVTAPWYLLFGFQGTAMPSYIAYGILIYLTFCIALRYTSVPSARLVTLIFMSAPVFVMQASNTDNSMFTAALTLASAYFLLFAPRQASSIVWSALALALATGTKPQLLLLGFPWIAGCFWLHQKVIVAKWKVLLLFVPVGILASALPTLLWSALHPVAEKTGRYFPSFENFVHSSKNIVPALLGIPYNPLANTLIDVTSIAQWRPVQLPDAASLGLLATLAVCVGIVFSGRAAREIRYLAIASIVLLFAGFAVTGASYTGRSFIGYMVLFFPLAIYGLAKLPLRILQIWGGICLCAALFYIAMNPHMPLLPQKQFERSLSAIGLGRFIPQVQTFYSFRGRIDTLKDLLERIPDDEKNIGVLCHSEMPLYNLWKGKRNVTIIQADTTLKDLQQRGIRYVLVSLEDQKSSQTDMKQFLSRYSGSILAESDQFGSLRRGPVRWFLVEIGQTG